MSQHRACCCDEEPPPTCPPGCVPASIGDPLSGTGGCPIGCKPEPVVCPPGCVPAAIGDPDSGTGGCPPGCKPPLLPACTALLASSLPSTLTVNISVQLKTSDVWVGGRQTAGGVFVPFNCVVQVQKLSPTSTSYGGGAQPPVLSCGGQIEVPFFHPTIEGITAPVNPLVFAQATRIFCSNSGTAAACGFCPAGVFDPLPKWNVEVNIGFDFEAPGPGTGAGAYMRFAKPLTASPVGPYPIFREILGQGGPCCPCLCDYTGTTPSGGYLCSGHSIWNISVS